MRKFIVYGLSFMVYLFVLTIYDIQYTIYAAESTPSSGIKAKLEELKKEIASKAAKLKQDISRKLKDKAYIGKVKSLSDHSITLGALSGPKIVSLNQDTVFESEIKRKIKFSEKSIEPEDYIAALGDIDETKVLTARKVILLPTIEKSKKTFLWGQVVSKTGKQITLKKNDSKIVTAILSTPTEINLDDFLIITGTFDKNDVFDAQFAYVILQKNNLSPDKTATPSAKTASPSAKITSPNPKSKATVKPSAR